jgi:hypothetical protein
VTKQLVFTVWMVLVSLVVTAGTPKKVMVCNFGTNQEKLSSLAASLQETFQQEVDLFSYYQLAEADVFTTFPDSINAYGWRDLPKAVRDTLEAKRVAGVFYGFLRMDEKGDDYVIECKLEDLKGKVLKRGRIAINIGKAGKEKELEKLARTLFQQMHERERSDQYDMISMRLGRYLSNLKDLQRQIQRMDRDIMRDGFLRDFRFYVMSYEEVIFDVLDRGAIYKSDFEQLWPKKYSRDLTSLFDEELEYFHYTYIDEPLQELVSRAAAFSAETSDEKRRALMAEIMDIRKAMLTDMGTNFPQLETTVNNFLQRCDREIGIDD